MFATLLSKHVCYQIVCKVHNQYKNSEIKIYGRYHKVQSDLVVKSMAVQTSVRKKQVCYFAQQLV